MHVHHISSILWELGVIWMQIGSSHLSMLRRQSMWLVFEFARLVTCVAPSVVGLFPANLQCVFPRSANSDSIKTIKKKSPGGTILFIVQNKIKTLLSNSTLKESTWCASLFRSKYSGIGHIYVLAYVGCTHTPPLRMCVHTHFLGTVCVCCVHTHWFAYIWWRSCSRSYSLSVTDTPHTKNE